MTASLAEKGVDYDIKWDGHYFEIEPLTRALVPLTWYGGKLLNYKAFRRSFSEQTQGKYDDPAAAARRFHDAHPLATADNVHFVANSKVIEEHVRFGVPLLEIDAFARDYYPADENQLRLPLTV